MAIHRRTHSKPWQRSNERERRTGLRAIVATQHVLLWASAYVLTSETYLLIQRAITADLLPTSIVLLVSAALSILCICFHSVAACAMSAVQTERRERVGLAAQWLATASLRAGLSVWLAGCGMNIIFTVARRASCAAGPGEGISAIDVGTACIIQRTEVGATLLSLLASLTLFILMHKISAPFTCHLFGLVKEQSLLPLMLPYKVSAEHSEMSFKCRSSSSLSSRTLVPSRNTSTSQLLPSCPEKAVFGLGIYAPKQYTPSFLTPRPSLFHTHTHDRWLATSTLITAPAPTG
ncbi:hypothetical protein LTR53_004156, partial [Teratosphaeriaceae sp. CCFEE 6253]